jgi:hypothetical protein
MTLNLIKSANADNGGKTSRPRLTDNVSLFGKMTIVKKIAHSDGKSVEYFEKHKRYESSKKNSRTNNA